MKQQNYYNCKYKGIKLKQFCIDNNIKFMELIDNIIELKKEEKFKNYKTQHLISHIIEGDFEETYHKLINELLFKKYCISLELPYNEIIKNINKIKKINSYLNFKDIHSIDIYLKNEYFEKLENKEKFIDMYTKEIQKSTDNIDIIKVLKTKDKYKLYEDEKLIEYVVIPKNHYIYKYTYKNISLHHYCKNNNLSYSYIISKLDKNNTNNYKEIIDNIINNDTFIPSLYKDSNLGALEFIKKHYNFINVDLIKLFFENKTNIEILYILKNYRNFNHKNNTLYELYAIYKSNLYQNFDILNEQLILNIKNYISPITLTYNIPKLEVENLITNYLDKDSIMDNKLFNDNFIPNLKEYINEKLCNIDYLNNDDPINYSEEEVISPTFSQLEFLTKEELTFLKFKLQDNLSNIKIADNMQISSIMISNLEKELMNKINNNDYLKEQISKLKF